MQFVADSMDEEVTHNTSFASGMYIFERYVHAVDLGTLSDEMIASSLYLGIIGLLSLNIKVVFRTKVWTPSD